MGLEVSTSQKWLGTPGSTVFGRKGNWYYFLTEVPNFFFMYTRVTTIQNEI